MDRAAPITARRTPVGLAWLAGVGTFGVGASALYATTGLGFPCPFRSATGWDCPFCGGTRMGVELLHLDVVSAFWFNPLAFIGLLAAIMAGLWLMAELVTGRRGWLAGRCRGLATRLPLPVTPATITIASLAALVVWTVLRNVALGPLP